MNPKQKLLFYNSILNKISLDYCFGKVKCLRDIFQRLDIYPYEYTNEQLDAKIDKKFVDRFKAAFHLSLTQNINYPPSYFYEFRPTSKEDYELLGITPPTLEPRDLSPIVYPEFSPKSNEEKFNLVSELIPQTEEEIKEENLKEPLPRILRPASTYGFWFQNKATREALDGILRKKFRAQLVEAPTGTGKTFIAGSLIEALWDPKLRFFKDCLSPWPCLYITRRSIVEQTQGVMTKVFGLKSPQHCQVINVEQLRSQFGRMMVEEKTVVRLGKPEIEWKWKPRIHPRVIFIDESHLAKNEDSTQSLIVQALAEVEDEIYIIFMSATPFMRVCEAKYFCINTHHQFR